MYTIREILEGREPYSVDSSWSIRRVVSYLCEKSIGAVAVQECKRVAGVFSERDLMHRVVKEGRDPGAVLVREVMSKGIIDVSPDEDYRVAKAMMLEEGVRHLVVLDDEGRLYGLVSVRELVEVGLRDYRALVSKLNDRYYRDAWEKR